MSQNSYILNPWILSFTTVLLVGAAYSSHFFQWNSLNNSQPHPSQIIQNVSSQTIGVVDVSRPAYFSVHSENTTATVEESAENNRVQKTTDPNQSVKSLHTDSSPQEIASLDFKDDEPVAFKTTSLSRIAQSEQIIAPKPIDSKPEYRKVQDLEASKAIVKPAQPSLDELLQALVVVEYPDEIVLEFEKSLFSENFMKQLLARFMLSPDPMDNYALLQSTLNKSPFRLREQPHYFQRILSPSKQPIRYPAQAYAYAENLLKTHRNVVEDQNKTYVQVSIPLYSLIDLTGLKAAKSKTLPAGKKLPFANFVEHFSREFSVDKELIYAIMEVESAFNPKAVSKSNALGLMQIKANSAGRDVYQYVDGKNVVPSKEALFNPKENIRIGTAYLQLLDEFYFADVEDRDKRELLAIASYNGGLNTVIKLFGKSSELAIERINALSKQSVLQRLIYQHPSEETRNYVQKVTRAKQNYRKVFS